MRHLKVWAIFALSFATLGYTESLEQICNVASGGFNCNNKVTIPTSAEIKKCSNKIFEVDSCKTKTSYRYPCPTWKNPGRWCDGWTCVPGTREKWVDVPCGLNIKTEKVGMCDAVKSNTGINPDILRRIPAMCKCIPQALRLSKTGALANTAGSSDISSTTSNLLELFAQLEKCILDNAFKIQDSRNDLTSTGDLSRRDGAIIIKAAEIDLVFYSKIAANIATCVVGACNVKGIQDIFMEYLRQSQNTISNQLKNIFQPWTGSFADIQRDLGSFQSSFNALIQANTAVQDDINTLGTTCNGTTKCAEETVKRFSNQVSQTLQLQLAVTQGTDVIPRLISDISKMSNLVKGVQDTASTPTNVEGLVTMIQQQKIKKLSDITQILRVTEDLPKLVKQLQGDISAITEFINGLNAKALVISDNITNIMSDSWTKEPDISSDATRQKIAAIQNRFHDQIPPIISDIKSKLAIIERPLSALPFYNKPSPTITAKVASYQRWSLISLNVPCSKWDTKEFNVGGFKGSFGYPKFYNCDYKETIPWPNHHIPYVKVQFS